MVFGRSSLFVFSAAALCAALSTAPVDAQESGVNKLPDAPLPQMAAVADWSSSMDGLQAQDPAQSSSQSTTGTQSAPPEAKDKTQREKAEEQIKEQEHQRVLGIVPQFNTSYRSDAVSLTGKQKISLAFHSAVDPFAFAGAMLVAGYHEANDDYGAFGWGAQGVGKRVGAAYLDAFDGTMIGNGILPAVLHQDPRYFRLGHGTTAHRILYSAATAVMCRHDNSHRWEPNYSNIGGNIAAGAISNLYYPSEGSGWSQTIENGMVVTVEGAAGGLFQEFWPDISRKLFHKDPTNGLDAQARAADAAAKAAQRQNKSKQPLPPAPK